MPQAAPSSSPSYSPFESPDRPDAAYIRGMFDRFARRYDIFTFLIGLGQDRRLRKKALESVGPGMRVLDIACGTGDLTRLAAEKTGRAGEVWGLDFSAGMIGHAKARPPRSGHAPIRWVVSPAERLPLETAPFDRIVSAYALRNLYENIGPILEGMKRSLKPGGRIALLDLTEPPDPFRRALYRLYFFVCVGIYGLLLFGRDYPVAYLPDSARRFCKPEALERELKKTGFTDVQHRSFMLGAVTLYEAAAIH